MGGLDGEYCFLSPPECYVFEPTEEEFKDSLAYIEKIRPKAEQHGICKIIPPPDWQPPFAVDVDKLRFVPRIQRLNELEAHTRIKLNFLDQVAKFWELQGSCLKIPLVDGRALDLYTLQQYVTKEGGMDVVNAEKKWQKIANDMGYNKAIKNIPAMLKAHYERIMFPLDIFEREKLKAKSEHDALIQEKIAKIDSVMVKKDDADSNEDKRTSIRRSKRCEEESKSRMAGSKSSDADSQFSKVLARLQFHGAGPKMAGIPTEQCYKEKTRGMKLNFEYDPLAKYMCQNCMKGDAEEQMLLCDGCDDSYHTFCLMPPMVEIPQGEWRCPKCIEAEVSKPMEAFGFEQAQKEYTLQKFGQMADQFKMDYFNMPLHVISNSLVEKEYWRILENIDEDVTIEYGADLHTMDHGSGFPTVNSINLVEADEVYAKSDWNLNCIPVVPNSILRCIDMDISGMKVPWLYVGMCFSTFCWHTEDHWTYSINYLHWGETKTWYGIPGSHAENAEKVMRQSAKELFLDQPDLLHHIVTTMNPNILQAHDIPVYRCDQRAGEFMITFPRAYHAGFNQGFNLAEAVNFAPPDWLQLGRKCVEHYALMQRYCVFCHDELVCRMATMADKLTLPVAAATYEDMFIMLEKEKEAREKLVHAGVREAIREAFELIQDDKRQCAICKTTCFLSALSSKDEKETDIVCLRHFDSMECDAGSLVLRYRYTLDELSTLINGLCKRSEAYDEWTSNVKKMINMKGSERLCLEEFISLLDEASNWKYPASDILSTLKLTVDEAQKCQTVVIHLAKCKKVRTRTRGLTTDTRYYLTVDELESVANQLEILPVLVPGSEVVTELLASASKFHQKAKTLLEKSLTHYEQNEEEEDGQDEDDGDELLQSLTECIDFGQGLDVELVELNELIERSKMVAWLKKSKYITIPGDKYPIQDLRDVLANGIELSSHPTVDAVLGRISGIISMAEDLEEKVKAEIAGRPKISIDRAKLLMEKCEELGCSIPCANSLSDSIRKATDWIAKVKLLQNQDNKVFLEAIEFMVTKGKALPVELSELAGLEETVSLAREWIERTSRVFLKKNSNYSLLDVLLPRHDIGSNVSAETGRKRRNIRDETSSASSSNSFQQHPLFQNMTLQEITDSQTIVRAFNDAAEVELESMIRLRSQQTGGVHDDKSVLMECELCLTFVHPSTVSICRDDSSDIFSGNKTMQTSDGAAKLFSKIRFLCPQCVRSKRPRIEAILPLILSLQKLMVKLPTGEALKCLTERAMAWQDRARSCLANEEVVIALESATPRPLSASCSSMLQDLLVAGDLIELSMDESDKIATLLKTTSKQRRSYPELKQLEIELGSVRREKLKKKKNAASATGMTTSKRRMEPLKVDSRRKKRKNVSKSGNTICSNSSSDDDGEDTVEEDCSANPSCKRPTGKQVHWVQCDSCELWFHLFCINLSPDDVSEDEEFNCVGCKSRRHGLKPK